MQRELEDWHEHVVAEIDDEVVGYANLTPTGWEPRAYPETRSMGDNWGYMPDLVVSPERRGKGIGTRLVAAVEDVARHAGARGLAVNPDPTGDEAALHRFYVLCGFEPVGPADWPYFFKRF